MRMIIILSTQVWLLSLNSGHWIDWKIVCAKWRTKLILTCQTMQDMVTQGPEIRSPNSP